MSNTKNYGNFPDPLASFVEKTSKAYGLKYARAIVSIDGVRQMTLMHCRS